MKQALRWAVVGVLLAAALLPIGGVRSQEGAARSAPEAVAAYRDAANLQNNGAFEVAAEEWQKFLRNFPRDPLAAKAQHYLGVCQLQLKQTDAAAATFAAVIKNHPTFELLEDAYVNLASAQYSMAAGGKPEFYVQAAESFSALLAAFPKGKYVDEAVFYLGESLYALGKKAEASAAYERLIREFPQSKRRAEALYALGVSQEEEGKHAEAGRTYDVFVREFPQSPLVPEIRMRKAETALQAGDVAAAERMFAEVAATKGFAAADHALSRQAFCLARLDRFAEAAALYAKVATEYPNSAHAADAVISAGRCYYRSGEMSAARQWLEKALARKDAGGSEAAHWLCRILMKSGQAAAAADLAARQLSENPEGPFAANLELDAADALYEMPAKRDEAIARYARFASDNPRHELAPQALYNAAFGALELKRYDGGLRRATAFLQTYPDDKLAPDVKYVAAECYLQLKEYGEAESLYRELVAKYPEHEEIENWRVRLGVVAHLQKKYDAVIAALAPVAGQLKSPESRAEALFLIGSSHFFSEQFAEAADALARSLEAKADWRQADEALLLMARARAKLGQPAEARAAIEKLLADFPQSALADQAHYRLGELAYAADDYQGAIGAYDVVVSKYPDSPFVPYALYGRGWSQLKGKNFAAGAASFTELVTKSPEHQLATDARFGRALCRRQAGDAKGAMEDIEAYLRSAPQGPQRSDALYERGLAQVAINDFPGAVATFGELLKADPQYAAGDKVLYEIGWALKSQDKNAEAAEYFAKLASGYPMSLLAAEAWFHVGEDRYEKKQYAEAASAYGEAKAKSPDGELGEKATYKLGWSHYQLKDYRAALAQFDEQLGAFPRGPLAADAAFMKAECLFRQENFKEAWPAYQAAQKMKASTPTIEVLTLLHGGQSAAQLKQWEESARMLSAIRERFPDTPLLAESLYELGWAKQNLGQTAESLQLYEAAADKSRDQVGARARFMMGELLFTQKDHTAAIREFQRAMFGYGGDQAAPETKNWQAKSGYEAGRCAEALASAASDAETRQKSIADARRFYLFVAEKHPSHELAGEAKKRVKALGER